MKISLLIVAFLIVNINSNNSPNLRSLSYIENTPLLKKCLGCTGKIPMKLLDQMDYIDLNSSYLTQTQVAAVKRCALSAGSKTPSLDGSTHEDSTIKGCIDNLAVIKKVSTSQLPSLYIDCKSIDKCYPWKNTIKTLYYTCLDDLDECESNDELPLIVKQCLDMNRQCKAHFGITN